MKERFKHFGILSVMGAIALIGLLAQPAAHAQQYAVSSVTVTNDVAANSTNGTDSAAIGLTKYDEFGLLIKFESEAANTSNTDWVFKYSLDGTTNFATASTMLITLAATGTTPVHFVTNIHCGSIGYIALDSIGNRSATVALTNISVKISCKPKRSG